MKDYIVTLKSQFPAWDEKNGIPYEITAKSKSDAIKKARRLAYDDGHVMSGKGRQTFTAVEAAA